MKVLWTHRLVMRGGMVFGKVVSQIVSAWAPMDREFAVGTTVLYPIKTHVNRFGTALFDSLIRDTCSTLVVCLERGCALCMAEFREGGTECGGFFGVVE